MRVRALPERSVRRRAAVVAVAVVAVVVVVGARVERAAVHVDAAVGDHRWPLSPIGEAP